MANKGRPQGTMEKKLSEAEVENVVGRCSVPERVVNQLMVDAKKVFDMAADSEVTITRGIARDGLWIVRELVHESPAHIVHADSTLSFCIVDLNIHRSDVRRTESNTYCNFEWWGLAMQADCGLLIVIGLGQNVSKDLRGSQSNLHQAHEEHRQLHPEHVGI